MLWRDLRRQLTNFCSVYGGEEAVQFVSSGPDGTMTYATVTGSGHEGDVVLVAEPVTVATVLALSFDDEASIEPADGFFGQGNANGASYAGVFRR